MRHLSKLCLCLGFVGCSNNGDDTLDIVTGKIGGADFQMTSAAVIIATPPETDRVEVLLGDFDICIDAPLGRSANSSTIRVVLFADNLAPAYFPTTDSAERRGSVSDFHRIDGSCDWVAGTYADTGGVTVTKVDGNLLSATLELSSPDGDVATGSFHTTCVVRQGPSDVCN